jgi:hypothetical protein
MVGDIRSYTIETISNKRSANWEACVVNIEESSLHKILSFSIVILLITVLFAGPVTVPAHLLYCHNR